MKANLGDTCTPQLLVLTVWEQPKTPMNECWINNTWCAYTLGNYSVQRGKENLIKKKLQDG